MLCGIMWNASYSDTIFIKYFMRAKMNYKQNNSVESIEKEKRAKIVFSVFFSLYTILALAATALNFILYNNFYDSALKLFENNALSKAAYYIAGAALLIALITLFIKSFGKATESTVQSGGFFVIIECFCGLLLIIFCMQHYLAKIGSLNDYRSLIMAVLLIAGALYYFIQAFSVGANKTPVVLSGLSLVIFLIGYIFFELYRIDNILVNSPVRIGAIMAALSILLFILSELRFYIGRASRRLYFAAGFLATLFSISDSLPKIYLCVMKMNGFSLDATAFFSCFELFAGIYAYSRLCHYLTVDAFSENPCSEYILIEDEDHEADGDLCGGDNEYERDDSEGDDTENDPGEGMSSYFSSYNVNILTDDGFLDDENDIDDNVKNDEPEFSANNVGEFDIQAYEAAEGVADDLPDDQEEAQVSNEAIEDEELSLEKKIISDLIAQIPDDLEEVIDFEKKDEPSEKTDDSPDGKPSDGDN